MNPATPPPLPEADALLEALQRLLAPLAELAVARGVGYAAVDDLLRQGFVAAANAAHQSLPEHRRVSRISTATGLTRREVSRRVNEPRSRAPGAAAPTPPRSLASEVFAHWRSDKRYRTRSGSPRVLPRTGPLPSFEALAHEITRDVHPRTLLEELLRLQLAQLDPQTDRVSLVEAAFVPRGDSARMLGFLGANVGDHLQAAVSNVLGTGPARHFEQAIFADGLSAQSLAAMRPLLADQWAQMTEALVPALERMVEADALDPPSADRRIRLGLYGFDTPAGLPKPGQDAGEPIARKTPIKTAAPRPRPRKGTP